MKTAYRKVIRDLWLHKGRTALVVLSIATGAMAVGMILTSNTLMARQMTAAQLASQASNVWLFLTGRIDAETVRSIEKLPEVERAMGRATRGVRWKPALDGEWQDADLTAIADYQKQSLDLLELRTGSWPAPDTVAVEWNHAAPFQVPETGGTIYMEINGRARAFEIAGTLRDPGVAAPPFVSNPSFYVTLDTLERLVGFRDFGELRFSLSDYSAQEAERVASIVENKLERAGVGVGFRWYQAPERHWAQDILDGIGLILTVMAVASLFLSAILVINTINAVITQQVPQIGIMKTVGGVRPQISRVYLAGVIVYGLLSLLLAVPLGALAGNALESWILGIINVPPARFVLLPSSLAIQLSTGLVVPLLAALWPVLRGVAITVREALSRYGLGTGHYGVGRLDRLLARVSVLPSLATLALRNTFRRVGRVALTEGVLITAGAIFMMVVTTHYSFTQAIADIWAGLGFDVFVVFRQPQRIAEIVYLLKAQPNVDQAEMWLWRDANARVPGERDRSQDVQLTVQGVPRGTRMYQPTLTEGRPLDDRDGPALLLNQKVAREMDLGVGDSIVLDLAEDGETSWTIVGLVYDLVNDQSTAYVHEDTLNAATGQVGRAFVARISVLDDRMSSQTALVEHLRDLFEAQGVDLAVARTSAEDRAEAEAQFSILTTILMTMTVVMATVGSIGLSGSLSISVMERRREIGVMRAVGASSRDVGTVFVAEGLMLGLFSWLVAVPISILAGRPFVVAIGEIIQFPGRYQPSVASLWIWLAIVVVLSLVASWLPARRATQISVNESLAYE